MYYYNVIEDRVFWIYALIIVTSTIIGISAIAGNTDSLISIIMVLWIFVNLILLFLIYLANNYSQCFSLLNRILINIVFAYMIVTSVLWASEFTYATGDTLISLAGILTIIGALLMLVLILPHSQYSELWLAITLIFIWVCMTIYVTISE